MQLICLLSTISAVLVALRPDWSEECGLTNPGACYDSAVYTLYLGLGRSIWAFDRTLLVLAYQLDHLRWWLASQAFLTAYDAIRTVVEPILAPAAMVAVTVGLLLVLLAPAFGRITLINIRQALIWLVFAPLLLAQAGPWLLGLEELRSVLGGAIVAQAAGVSTQGLFGAPGQAGDEPLGVAVPLYPPGGPGVCASGQVSRPRWPGAVETGGLRMDDLAAALLLVNAQDLHCPGEQPPDADLPDGFYTAEYVVEVGALEMMDSVERAAAIQGIQRGITRLVLGVAACWLAVVEALIQFIFSLSLAVLWLSLPLVAVLVLFSDSLRPLGRILQRVVGVVLTGLLVSIVLALIAAALNAAAMAGSAVGMMALSFGGLFLATRLLLVALMTLNDCFTGVAALSGSMAGVVAAGSAGAIAGLARRAARSAGGMARGGYQRTRSASEAVGQGRSALSTSRGRLAPISQVGAVAAGMLAAGRVAGAGRSLDGDRWNHPDQQLEASVPPVPVRAGSVRPPAIPEVGRQVDPIPVVHPGTWGVDPATISDPAPRQPDPHSARRRSNALVRVDRPARMPYVSRRPLRWRSAFVTRRATARVSSAQTQQSYGSTR